MATQTREFQLTVAEDRMSLRLVSAPIPESLEALAGRILEALNEIGIRPLPEAEQVVERLRGAPRSENSLGPVGVLEGRPAIEPTDAVLEWEGDFFSPGFAVDPLTGQIDYRRRAAQPEVKPDQLLARLKPAVAGQPGLDVFGKRIRVGFPRRINVHAGNNVRVEEEGAYKLYYATIAGRVRWDMRAISVDDVFKVGGDVNMASGNIKHNGAVLVTGDVKRGFSIQADGDVEVMGTVEGANIKTGGNLIVRGGISGGRGTYCIKAAGNVLARFLLDVNVETNQDVLIEKEIVNSCVMACGEVKLIAGRIVGGETWALGGVKAGWLGNERSSPTLVAAGVDPLAEREIARCEGEIEKLNEEIRSIDEATEPKLNDLAHLSTDQRLAFTELLTRSAECFLRAEKLQNEIELLRARAAERAVGMIQVAKEVYGETNLRIKQAALLLHNTMIGPIRFDLHNNEVRFRKIESIN